MNNKSKEIYVTQPEMPRLSDFVAMLEEIWSSKILTNNGPYHQAFEKALAEYLSVPHVSLYTNGTIALAMALYAMELEGEVITTPYSFAATAHAIWFNKLTPVFADIDPVTGNIDPVKVEKAITANTKAILAVHVYGRPCDVTALQRIASKHNLKLIYDAAHAFDVYAHGRPVVSYGDVSVLSFHSTKVFNTFEGGAIVCRDESDKKRFDLLKNFGISSETTMEEPGLNGKMNELQAAFGLLQLRDVKTTIGKRKTIALRYREKLANVPGISFADVDYENPNYNYFPIQIDANRYGHTRDELYEALRINKIHPRRYFYPLITDFEPYRNLPSAQPGNIPNATAMAASVLCLPVYASLEEDQMNRIVEVIKNLHSPHN